MVTPFDTDGKVDLRAAEKLVARFITEGAGGLYLTGSTGEAPLLRVEERRQFTECVVKSVAGQIPVMVQVGHTAPVLAVELAEHAARCGADSISSTLPPFYPYTPGQIAAYWSELTATSDLPFYGYVMHDMGQGREGIYRWLEVMSHVPHLAGLKFTNADAHQLALLKHWENGRLNILSGHDQGYLACKAQGADGAIGTTYNVALPLFVEMTRLYEAGQTEAAAAAMIDGCDIVGTMASGYFLTKVKLILRKQGIDCGLPRSPYRADVEIPDSLIAEMTELIAAVTRKVRALGQAA